VLVRPSDALNVGAVARAMANFGLEDLAAVSPYAPHWRAARSAVYGTDILARARTSSLADAVADCRLVLGTASAHNRALRRETVALPALRAWLARRRLGAGRVAILFGAERNGLTNAELDHCHALLRIPTDARAPSMNLGQAAALVACELARPGLDRAPAAPAERRPDARRLESLVDAAMRAMSRAGVNAHLSEAARRAKFRRGLLKWRLGDEDASFLIGLLSRLARLTDTRSNAV
jgi:TrmH family RNA methyltransferase